MKLPTVSAAMLIGTALFSGIGAVHAQQLYTITPIVGHPQALPDQRPLAQDLNDKGEVVGSLSSFRFSDPSHPFLWRAGEFIELTAIADPKASAIRINNKSEVIGTFRPPGEQISTSFLLRRSGLTILEIVSGESESARAINDRGVVAGVIRLAGGGVTGFLWRRGHVTSLEPLPGATSVNVVGLNNHGVAVGTALFEAGQQLAVIWKDGKPLDLGLLPGAELANGMAINDHGQVVGEMRVGTRDRAFVWQRGNINALPDLEGAQSNQAWDINKHGEVVGFTRIDTGTVATFWDKDGVPINLNDAISSDDPSRPFVTLTNATRINNRGQILTGGADSRVPEPYPDFPIGFSFLLTPVR